MITNSVRLKLISRAVFSFNQQTHQEKELIIVHDDSEEFDKYLRKNFESNIVKIFHLEKSNLGSLRNKSVELASGTVICQWDDDDYSHPKRLEIQFNQLIESKQPACFISSHTYQVNNQTFFLDKSLEKLFISPWRVAQNSLMAYKDKMPSYPEISIGEDSSVVEHFTFDQSVTTVADMPYLFCTTYHGNNAWDINHHMEIVNTYVTTKYRDKFNAELFKLLKCNDVI